MIGMPAVAQRTHSRARYLGRALRVCLEHPVEGLDRVRGRMELALWGGKDFSHPVSADWERRLHEALGAPYPCGESKAFNELWTSVDASADGGIGRGHDVDRAVARAAWCITRHLAPRRVVETGVARGLSTRVVLEALARNENGHLWSIDLPPVVEGWHRQVAALVPTALRERWTYVRGSSRRHLPRLLKTIGDIDLFMQTSLLTEPNVRFELDRAWKALRPGGSILAEGINRSRAFPALVRRESPAVWLIGRSDAKPELFGIALKP